MSFNALGIDFEIPKYMFWIAPVYVAIAITLTHALGHPLSGLLAEEQKREADFRSALIHVRENAPAVAHAERRDCGAAHALGDASRTSSSIWFQVIRREFIFGLFQRPYFQTVLRIPIFIALPAFLAGKITLGGLMQLATSFQHVVTNLSWFVFNYKFLSDLVATTRRMQRFLDAVQAVPAEPAGPPRLAPGGTAALRIADLAIRTPDGRTLLEIDELTVAARSDGLAQRRFRSRQEHAVQDAGGPLAACRRHGRIAAKARICFLPQQVYLPLDTLPASAIYPALPDSFPRRGRSPAAQGRPRPSRRRRRARTTSGLSVGEQQRLALARVLAAKPDWVFLDEATSALDIESERMLMTLLRTELPDATFVVVAHREPQGLANVARVDLSRQTAEDRALKLAAH